MYKLKFGRKCSYFKLSPLEKGLYQILDVKRNKANYIFFFNNQLDSGPSLPPSPTKLIQIHAVTCELMSSTPGTFNKMVYRSFHG